MFDILLVVFDSTMLDIMRLPFFLFSWVCFVFRGSRKHMPDPGHPGRDTGQAGSRAGWDPGPFPTFIGLGPFTMRKQIRPKNCVNSRWEDWDFGVLGMLGCRVHFVDCVRPNHAGHNDIAKAQVFGSVLFSEVARNMYNRKLHNLAASFV